MHPHPPAYRTREFAQLAGVTVRALHHYDRLGLLKPQRTAAGYRIYSSRDLEALEQIVVLKFIGISLRDIAILRQHGPDRLGESLRAQHELLKKKRGLLDQAIGAIAELEAVVSSGQEPDPALFRRISEVIEMQNDTDSGKREYQDLVRKKIDALGSMSENELSALQVEWRALTSEIRQALDEDPASAKAQALGTRWRQLLERLVRQPVSTEDLQEHQRRHEWNPGMASFVEKPVWDFMTRVLAAHM